ncbi:glycoside hydrolase family 16 protein [Curtobacterium sp. Leaf261]|uniref:glycoside hydrolase family 16 protein n=1 Tax=Curtobacterium sp. Leaf261 TaxID=1736311 RepID=UPI0006FC2827|nr:glycoside hydrolase family 16 protein [Curtobacterium sp. Leaf261]KQO62397.1 hypothetical protein ASF23_11530 [Curtobacterium sp. Leaf261]
MERSERAGSGRRAGFGRRAAVWATAIAVIGALSGCTGAGAAGGSGSGDGDDPARSSDGASSAPSGTAGTQSADTERDDFTGKAGTPPDASVWTAQTGAGGWGNEELQTYTRDAVALDGKGHLAITAHIGGTASAPTYTSGRITTQGKYEFTNGTLSARIKLPDGPGLLPAFWLLGADVGQVGWPRAGEIDIVEAPHGTGSTSHNIHGPNRYLGSQDVPVSADVTHDPKLSEGFHVFSVTKTADSITMRIDGDVAAELDRATAPPTLDWVFDQPMNILFSLAIGGKWPGNPTSATPSTSRMLIDWIQLTRTS